MWGGETTTRTTRLCLMQQQQQQQQHQSRGSQHPTFSSSSFLLCFSLSEALRFPLFSLSVSVRVCVRGVYARIAVVPRFTLRVSASTCKQLCWFLFSLHVTFWVSDDGEVRWRMIALVVSIVVDSLVSPRLATFFHSSPSSRPVYRLFFLLVFVVALFA